jgi:hypothetical protein
MYYDHNLIIDMLTQTVEEAIQKYESLAKTIFEKKLPWLTRWDATYDHN